MPWTGSICLQTKRGAWGIFNSQAGDQGISTHAKDESQQRKKSVKRREISFGLMGGGGGGVGKDRKVIFFQRFAEIKRIGKKP